MLIIVLLSSAKKLIYSTFIYLLLFLNSLHFVEGSPLPIYLIQLNNFVASTASDLQLILGIILRLSAPPDHLDSNHRHTSSMASEWFRPAFIRIKTPILGQSIPSADRPSNLATYDTNDSEESSALRFRTASRVTSYMPFHPSTPPVPTADLFPNIRNPETVYHQPSGDRK